MRQAISSLERMPQIRAKMVDKLNNLNRDYSEEQGKRGLEEGFKTQQRLKSQLSLRKKEQEKQLEQMIQLTAQTNVLHAIKLSDLLKPKWTEEPNAYKIISKITTQKQRNRLKELCGKRMF